jgi:hypothetical protein
MVPSSISLGAKRTLGSPASDHWFALAALLGDDRHVTRACDGDASRLTRRVSGAVLFDLDETLIVEEPAALPAFEATAQLAAREHALDAVALADAATGGKSTARRSGENKPNPLPPAATGCLRTSMVSVVSIRPPSC